MMICPASGHAALLNKPCPARQRGAIRPGRLELAGGDLRKRLPDRNQRNLDTAWMGGCYQGVDRPEDVLVPTFAEQKHQEIVSI